MAPQLATTASLEDHGNRSKMLDDSYVLHTKLRLASALLCSCCNTVWRDITRSNSFNSALYTESSPILVPSNLHLLKVAQSRIIEFSGPLRKKHYIYHLSPPDSVGLSDLIITSFLKCLNATSRIITHYLPSTIFSSLASLSSPSTLVLWQSLL